MHRGDRRAWAEQADIPAGEVERVQTSHLQRGLLAKGDLGAGRTARGDGGNFRDREIALGQGFQHFAPDRSGGADNRDPVAHKSLLLSSRPGAALPVHG